MNAQEMLDVLDVIRNEELYNQRIAELKEAEKQYNESKFIAETVKKAQRVLEQAEDKLKDYTKLIEDADKEINKKYDVTLAQVLRDRDTVNAELDRVADLKKKLDIELQAVEKERKVLLDETKELERLRGLAKTDQDRAEAIRNKYTDKFTKIMEILNG